MCEKLNRRIEKRKLYLQLTSNVIVVSNLTPSERALFQTTHRNTAPSSSFPGFNTNVELLGSVRDFP